MGKSPKVRAIPKTRGWRKQPHLHFCWKEVTSFSMKTLRSQHVGKLWDYFIFFGALGNLVGNKLLVHRRNCGPKSKHMITSGKAEFSLVCNSLLWCTSYASWSFVLWNGPHRLCSTQELKKPDRVNCLSSRW